MDESSPSESELNRRAPLLVTRLLLLDCVLLLDQLNGKVQSCHGNSMHGNIGVIYLTDRKNLPYHVCTPTKSISHKDAVDPFQQVDFFVHDL